MASLCGVSKYALYESAVQGTETPLHLMEVGYDRLSHHR